MARAVADRAVKSIQETGSTHAFGDMLALHERSTAGQPKRTLKAAMFVGVSKKSPVEDHDCQNRRQIDDRPQQHMPRSGGRVLLPKT